MVRLAFVASFVIAACRRDALGNLIRNSRHEVQVNSGLDDTITVESILEGFWGEEARRDMLEYTESISRSVALDVSELNSENC